MEFTIEQEAKIEELAQQLIKDNIVDETHAYLAAAIELGYVDSDVIETE